MPNSMTLSSASATTGTLSMSCGSLFYSQFTSFHYFDDYLLILYYRLDVELDCSGFGYSFLRRLLAWLRATRETTLFRCCDCRISARVGLTAQRPRQRLCVQRAHGSAHPARAHCPRASPLKSASIILTYLSHHLPYSSGDRMGCGRRRRVALARTVTL